MFKLMLFMFCFFMGSIAMFIYVLRRMAEQTRTLSDEHAQLRVLMRAMESRLDKITHLEVINANYQRQMEADGLIPAGMEKTDTSAGHDPLLHLSFEQPHHPEINMGQKLDFTPSDKSWDLTSLPGPKPG